jgi:hypothetical protein
MASTALSVSVMPKSQEGVACAEGKHGELAFFGETGLDESVDDLGGGTVPPSGEKMPSSVCRGSPHERRGVPRLLGEGGV